MKKDEIAKEELYKLVGEYSGHSWDEIDVKDCLLQCLKILQLKKEVALDLIKENIGK